MRKYVYLLIAIIALLPHIDVQAGRPSKKQINNELRSIMAANNVSAMSIAIVKGNKVIYSNALGLKDRETGNVVRTNDVYRIASISKSFTGVAIMQLVEQGKLALDSDVRDVLGANIRNPKYPDIPITVRLLLCHCSSIIDGKVAYGTFNGLDTDHSDDTTSRIYADWAPGAKYSYSNRGTNLLGCIVEKVSGERFDLYIKSHILNPLGILNAGFNVDDINQESLVALYKVTKDGQFKPSPKAYSRNAEKKISSGNYVIGVDAPGFSPCGGMKISVMELAKWLMMLKNRGVGQNGVRILSEQSVDMMFMKQTPDCVKTNYGFCLTGNGKILGSRLSHGHTGSAYGLKSGMFFSPSEDWGFVAMCSSHGKADRKAYSQAVEYLASVLIDK